MDVSQYDSEFLIVTCTCSNEVEAQHIAKELVDRRLAACVQISGPITSVYRWQGEVESTAEHLLLIKTTSDRFDQVRDAITTLHSYDTPEIVAVPIITGSHKYLNWWREQVSSL